MKARRRAGGFNLPQGCVSLPSVELAGRSVALSIDVPAGFDAPLAAHHKLIGSWVASRETSDARFTRPEVRKHVEGQFEAAVLEILKPFELAELRVVVLAGQDDLPPAIAVICDTVGQIELGWIENSNPLSAEPGKRVAPMRWCAAAYKALSETLSVALPIFGYADLFEEMSGSSWEGATDDVSAIRAMVEYQGADPDDIDQEMLPSAMNARRPVWMLAENAAPMKQLPAPLRKKISRLHDLRAAITGIPAEANAWHWSFDKLVEYVPDYEDVSSLPSMTLVPADHFARELDYVGEWGMHQGFMDIAGLCPLADAAAVDAWFASLKLGAEFLLAAQELISTDPANS